MDTTAETSLTPTAPRLKQLSEYEQDTVGRLVAQLTAKAPRNKLRASFYDMKNVVRDLGISTPPSMRNLEHVLGWSAKAVDVLNRRCRLEGFVTPGADTDFGVGEIWDDNYLDVEAPQAGVSSLIQCASFLVTHQGDADEDEPEVLITAKDALSGTGDWSRRLRRLTSFLSVIDTDDEGRLTDFALYLPNLTVMCRKTGTTWDVEHREHTYGLPVEVLPYQPRLNRPFGASRISRGVMSLHKQAVRSMRRAEATAEFYAATRVILLGAGEEAFKDGAWKAALSVIYGVPDDTDAGAANNGRAEVKTVEQASQEPHLGHLRMLAQQFSGMTSIPLASLGISGDANPTSSEAYDAGRDDLYAEAEGTTDAWSPGWRRAMLRALAMRNGWSLDAIPDEAKSLQPKWRDPRTPSRAAAADAASKTLDKFPWLADSELGLELYGFDAGFIARAMAEKRLQQGRATLAGIVGADTAAQPAETGDQPPAG